MTESAPAARAPRLTSVDTLRGFTMFWIVGGDALFRSFAAVSDHSWAEGLAGQFHHPEWVGLRFYDLILPMFIFIVGVSVVLAIGPTVEPRRRGRILWRVATRTAVLLLLGVVYYDGLKNGFDQIRLVGVLQRIALCYLFASIAHCYLGARGIMVLAGVLLVGYWLALWLVPFPGVGANPFAIEANLARYVDSNYLPLRRLYGDWDPLGLLSTVPAVATCLLGVAAGRLLVHPRVPPLAKVRWLYVAGVLAIALGGVWALHFPVIKSIWSSSYALICAGAGALCLAAFYRIIDLGGHRRWTTPFLWIGTNAIAVYMVEELISFESIAKRFIGGPIEAAAGPYGHTLVALATIGLVLAFAGFLYRRGVFIKV